MSRSVKANYFFNLLNTGTQLLFPLITFPYASRIMMADGIGQVNFFSSIISYISLFTCLGIPMYAIREVAKVRDNPNLINKVSIEILLLHGFLTILGYLAVAIICMTVSKVQTDIPLFLILSTTIFFTAIGCEWFYQGIEDFKYVAIRGFVVKVVSAILLFLFVKTKDDILWYGTYTVFGVLGGNIFNFIRLRKYLHSDLAELKSLRPFRHLKPVLNIFVFNVVISIYLQLNSILLGFLKDAQAVGYFVTATKILIMTMAVSTSLGQVMMPRISNLIAEHKMEEFKALAQKSYYFIVMLTLPLTVGLIFTAPYIVVLLSGNGFIPSILAARIVSPILFVVGLSNVMGIQILYPLGQINKVIICTAIGAVVNIVMNVWLIPNYAQNGTAVAYLTAEIAVTLSMFFVGKKYLPIRFFSKALIPYISGSAIMAFILSLMSFLPFGNLMKLICMIICGSLVYVLILLLSHDNLLLPMINNIRNKFIRQ